jgi:hypothetical protein
MASLPLHGGLKQGIACARERRLLDGQAILAFDGHSRSPGGATDDSDLHALGGTRHVLRDAFEERLGVGGPNVPNGSNANELKGIAHFAFQRLDLNR